MTDYAVAMNRKPDGTFVLRIPALCLIVEDASLETAWTRLETEKQDLIRRHADIGAEGDLPKPPSDTGNRDLKKFALKTGIVALAACMIVAAMAFSFSYAVREPLRKSGLKLGRAAIAQLEDGLRDAARNELTPERREKIRMLVAEAAPALKPYITELRPLFAEACRP